jgi:hypothetical protein
LQTKVFRLSEKIFVLLAGDTATLLGVCQTVQDDLAGQSDPISVDGAASLFGEHFDLARRRRAEELALSPFGLTLADYTNMQGQPAPNFVDEVNRAIVGGVDEAGAHVLTVHYLGIVQPRDNVGFATIGIGAELANAEFMSTAYAPTFHWVLSLLLSYWAKRRAEAAPGVGPMTDLVVISDRGVQQYDALSYLPDFLRALYDKRTTANLDARKADAKKLFDLFAEHTANPTDLTELRRDGERYGDANAAESSPSRPRNHEDTERGTRL